MHVLVGQVVLLGFDDDAGVPCRRLLQLLEVVLVRVELLVVVVLRLHGAGVEAVHRELVPRGRGVRAEGIAQALLLLLETGVEVLAFYTAAAAGGGAVRTLDALVQNARLVRGLLVVGVRVVNVLVLVVMVVVVVVVSVVRVFVDAAEIRQENRVLRSWVRNSAAARVAVLIFRDRRGRRVRRHGTCVLDVLVLTQRNLPRRCFYPDQFLRGRTWLDVLSRRALDHAEDLLFGLDFTEI